MGGVVGVYCLVWPLFWLWLSLADGGNNACVIGFLSRTSLGLQNTIFKAFRASFVALTKALLLKYVLPVHVFKHILQAPCKSALYE